MLEWSQLLCSTQASLLSFREVVVAVDHTRDYHWLADGTLGCRQPPSERGGPHPAPWLPAGGSYGATPALAIALGPLTTLILFDLLCVALLVLIL